MALETACDYIPPVVDPEVPEGDEFGCPDAEELHEVAEVPADDVPIDTISSEGDAEDEAISASEKSENSDADGEDDMGGHVRYNPERDGRLVTSADLERLYRDHAHQLLPFLVRMVGNIEDARDLLQDTFLKAFKGIDDAQVGEKKVSSWLFRVAGNSARDLLRRRRLAERLMDVLHPTLQGEDDESRDLEDLLPADVDGADYPDIIGDQIAVRAVLEWMPRHMAAHLMYILDETPPCVLAALVGTTETAMKMHGARARALFRTGIQHYQEHGRVPDTQYELIESALSSNLRYLTPAQRLGVTALLPSDDELRKSTRRKRSA